MVKQRFASQFTTGILSRLAEIFLTRKYDKVFILRRYRPRPIEMRLCLRHNPSKS
ncbi:hypothetical protein AAW06_04535 [Escherichia coli]|nr:hypothetical protein AAW06_04535 [Escherichia coli]